VCVCSVLLSVYESISVVAPASRLIHVPVSASVARHPHGIGVQTIEHGRGNGRGSGKVLYGQLRHMVLLVARADRANPDRAP